ncbi:MAG: hypothetical protein ACK56Z_17945 [Pseudanabaena sp.]
MAKILIGRFLESKYSVGKTAGQALDSLITELGESGFTALLVIQYVHPDQFFNESIRTYANRTNFLGLR